MSKDIDTSSTQAAALQPLFTTSTAQFPSLGAFRTWLESQGGASGVMQTSAAIEIDLNADGRNELIVQLSAFPSGALGVLNNQPSPNRLLVFAIDEQSNYREVTSQYFVPNANAAVSLAGRIAGFAQADLNADGIMDLALALNRDDGRSLSSELATQSVVLLSQADGGFRQMPLEMPQGTSASVAESVAIISRGPGQLPQVVLSTKELLADTGASLVRYELQGSGASASFQPLASSMVENTVKLIPLSPSLLAGSASTRLLALDDARGVIQYRVNADGSFTETGASFPLEINEIILRTESGKLGEFSTEPSLVRTVLLDETLYIVRGFDAATYIQPAKGAEVVLAVAIRLQKITANEDGNGDYLLTALGAERSLLQMVSPGVYEPGVAEIGQIKAGSESGLSVVSLKALDIDGDGHQDLAVSYQGGTPGLGIFMNAGSGNFYPVSASSLPDPSDLIRGTRGDIFPELINLGPDQASDILYVNFSSSYNGGNYYLFKGTGAIGNGPGFNAASVIGFNENYYLENNEEALSAVETGLYASGLDHYLAAGSPTDALIFAPGTRLYGTEGGDVIRAREGAEWILAAGGNDIIYPGEGNDTVDAGSGIDLAVYGGQRAQYQVTKLSYQGQSGWQVADPIAGETDILIGVEKLQFAQAFEEDPKSEVTLDVEGNPAVAFRLYRAAFAREPDLAGLGYWVDVLIQNKNDPTITPDQNLLLLDIASAFVGSEEFKSLYGDEVSAADYVLNLYKNTLGRDPLELNPATGQAYDQAGYDYWRSVLEAGYTTKQHMFVFFSESQENKDAVAGLIGQGVEYIPWAG